MVSSIPYKFISSTTLVDKQLPRLSIAFFSEMIEHVGNEYIEEFFRCCESILAKDGLFVLQVMITWQQECCLCQAYSNFEILTVGAALTKMHNIRPNML